MKVRLIDFSSFKFTSPAFFYCFFLFVIASLILLSKIVNLYSKNWIVKYPLSVIIFRNGTFFFNVKMFSRIFFKSRKWCYQKHGLEKFLFAHFIGCQLGNYIFFFVNSDFIFCSSEACLVRVEYVILRGLETFFCDIFDLSDIKTMIFIEKN